jgi:tetratricopeptide (TPR) repeat protein
VVLLEENVEVSRRAHGPMSGRTISLTNQLVEAYAALDRYEDARPYSVQVIDARRRIADASPSDPSALNNFAWTLVTCEPADLRDPQKALEFALRVNELTNSLSHTYLDTLALAYFQTGDVAKAIETQRTAVDRLSPGHSDRIELEERLAEYEQAADGSTS